MKINKIYYWVVEYWYYFFIASAIFQIFFVQDLTTYLFPIATIAGINAMSKIKWNNIDIIVLTAILYCMISFCFSDYPTKLYLYGVKKQVMAMMFYYVARSKHFRKDSFIENFWWSMLFVIVSGIYLFFLPPEWYTEFRYIELTATEGTSSFYEHTRMSSFFPHPYFLGYGSCFFIIYLISKILIERRVSYLQYVCLALAVFTLFFSQMRIAIAYTIVFLILVSIYSKFFLKINNNYLKFILVLVPLSFALFYIIANTASSDFLRYVSQRTIENEDNLVSKRFDQFSFFLRYASFWGNGLGRFGHNAIGLGLPSIADNDYIRTICEIGFLGLFFIAFPILYAIFKGFLHLKKTFIYTFILLFFPFAMLGATPLESESQHSFLLWFCVGQIIKQTSCVYSNENITRIIQRRL